MRNMLALVAALVITVAVVGWYLGWYHISSTTTPAGHRIVNIDIDATKLGEDLKRGGKAVLEKGQEQLDKALDRKQNVEPKPMPPLSGGEVSEFEPEP
jgi:hypothetical protein